ncbi:unnamed protein product [Hydatigera taeniaeformis]|uniref:Fibronectin type-III domain-containing protein n=1 Tax=Hydatigena taeniaeformis TaxID=6205 RepID=A0A0R3XBI0_HYDTA|nr:unnamed protein product [Hydatigera taeniaeformis]
MSTTSIRTLHHIKPPWWISHEAGGLACGTQAKVISLQPPFYETSVGSRAIRYKWDPEGRNDLIGCKVTFVSATSADTKPAKVVSVGISDGEVILGGLTPRTLYTVNVAVTRGEKEVYSTWDRIKTLATGKFGCVVLQRVVPRGNAFFTDCIKKSRRCN